MAEFGQELPFIPLRYFITFEIPTQATRGEHAHRTCHQFLVCVRGRCCVRVNDGIHEEEVLLNRPTLGIYVPPMVWAVEYKHSFDSALMVFASHHYDPDDYIRDYDEFLSATSAQCLPGDAPKPASHQPRYTKRIRQRQR